MLKQFTLQDLGIFCHFVCHFSSASLAHLESLSSCLFSYSEGVKSLNVEVEDTAESLRVMLFDAGVGKDGSDAVGACKVCSKFDIKI